MVAHFFVNSSVSVGTFVQLAFEPQTEHSCRMSTSKLVLETSLLALKRDGFDAVA